MKNLGIKEQSEMVVQLDNIATLSKMRDVAGSDVGDPLNNNRDSENLRNRFCLEVKFNNFSITAFNNNGAYGSVQSVFLDAPDFVRLAVCRAVASLWTPSIGAAARKRDAAIDAAMKGES